MHLIRPRRAPKGAPVSNPNCISIRNPGFAPRVSRRLTFEFICHLNSRLDSGLGAGLSDELTAGLNSRVKPLLIAQLDPDFEPHLKAGFKSMFSPSLTSRLARVS